MEDDIVSSITPERPINTEGHLDENDDGEVANDAPSYPSNRESIAAAELLRRFFITRGHDDQLVIMCKERIRKFAHTESFVL